MPLTIEDGTNVAGANSYATLDQIREYNTLRGVALPASDDAVTALAIVGMDYLATFDNDLAGHKTYGILQRLAWPRACVVVGASTVLPSNVVPFDIVDAQCYLAGIAQSLDLYGNQDTRAITKEVIGPIETDYSGTQGAGYGPTLPTLAAKLKPYLRYGIGTLRSVRV